MVIIWVVKIFFVQFFCVFKLNLLKIVQILVGWMGSVHLEITEEEGIWLMRALGSSLFICGGRFCPRCGSLTFVWSEGVWGLVWVSPSS